MELEAYSLSESEMEYVIAIVDQEISLIMRSLHAQTFLEKELQKRL